MTAETRPPTSEELLARLPDVPHTGNYQNKDIGSLGVPCPIKRKAFVNEAGEGKKREKSSGKTVLVN